MTNYAGNLIRYFKEKIGWLLASAPNERKAAKPVGKRLSADAFAHQKANKQTPSMLRGAWLMLRVCILSSSCGCTRERWRAREKRRGYSRRIRQQLLLL